VEPISSAAARLVVDGLREALADPATRAELLPIVGQVVPDLLAAGLIPHAGSTDGWVDSRGAAAHLGMSYDAFKKVMWRMPSAQDAVGCKRYYRRSDLDAWREARKG